ncbi:ribosome quality control complex subunit NEMF homolog [Diorhabda carinulata]|uniref:ribosome quality control complex subunit NEMF homolog n=1 Tax=Diorhabda carinulata TaxID=1163345 RepID=UPI0025A14B12|nr:ribosome quality control complex subunit NEMF homolog [Diorhabda carinulata]
MKTRFNTYDIICITVELQKLIGMRVNNIYDIDNKTYLIRLQRSEEKQILLLESGNRCHITNFEWPKNIAPCGFSMKMRKHLKNKRLESLSQLGTDRIIDLQFGSGEAAYHVILELYDRGNIILTDYEYIILYVLRPHTEGDKIKFAVKEKYPQGRAREGGIVSKEKLLDLLTNAKPVDQLKKVLVSNLEYGPAVLEHVLLKHNFPNATKIGKSFNPTESIDEVMDAIRDAENIFQTARGGQTKGYIVQKKEACPVSETNPTGEFYSNQEFHPMLFEQHSSMPHKEFPSFNEAVDEFFSSLESQKIELRAFQQERDAMKKLENVRKDHDQRLSALEKTQTVDKQKAELITRNQELVERAILAIQTLLANQMSWEDISDMVQEAASKQDPVAKHIKQLKLEINHISLQLFDPYADHCSSNGSDDNDDKLPPMVVDIDLALSAFANARKYYDQRRSAAKKQKKTIESQIKALKSAEKKTKQTLKEVQTITNINKARKTYWFEKFFWFISSENYLIIGGRDQQQNELIVKRYMRPTDAYVHADIHGASSIIIKNPTGNPIPPKTLNEAGTMAICYSVAWEAKVVTSAFWVWGNQVSKTAPTGEYLTTGSFMIRGKKNYLPPSHLVLGLSFLFKLEDGSVDRHRGERRVLTANEEDVMRIADSVMSKDEVEVEILDESDEDEEAKTSINVNTGETVETLVPEESNKEDSNIEVTFPETQINVQHSNDDKTLVTQSAYDFEKEPEGENVIYLGDDKPIFINQGLKTRSRGDSESQNKPKNERVDSKKENNKTFKRGQKGKLKKIKEKYKDQDEEERRLRMEILQAPGNGKESKKNKKNKESNTDKNKKPVPKGPKQIAPKQPLEEVDDDDTTVQADIDMIDALTGYPVTEDELLFAVPVIAPYNTLSNYKFKVKLTPGTAKRGKAAKTAVAIFLKDRTITSREKDLLKAVKDEQLARNLPGKVKLSAPKLQTIRK